jgi:hypothetical protein
MGTDIIIYVCVTDAFEMEKVPMTGSLSFILYKHIFLSQTDLTRTGIISNCYNQMFEAYVMSFYVSTATFFLLHCDEWDRVVALPRHKFVTGATLLQLGFST